MSFAASVHAKAIELTRLSLEMTASAGSGHPSSAASLAHIVTVLLYSHMRHDPPYPDHPAADRLVLSEGHACPIVYAAGADLGIAIGKDSDRRPMTRDDAMRLREVDSEIDGHPNPQEGFPFFPAATGSLGQGLSVAAGLALAARLDGSDKNIYCLIGDGESREGQVWEALDFIADHDLKSVCPIFNCNGYGQASRVSRQQSPEATAARLVGMGFDARSIDGHDPEAIRSALGEHVERRGDPKVRPFAIVASTVKGWGFLAPEDGNIHGKPVEGNDFAKGLAVLDETATRLGAELTEGDLATPRLPAANGRRPAPSAFPTFSQAMRQFGHGSALENRKYATRKAYGVALRALGHARRDVVALDADVRNSTFAEMFSDDPALSDRFFECRIGEQNMVSCAGGLAAAGKVPFASSFGKFVTRGYDQLEMALISRFNLKLVGSHSGANIAADGPSQMALSDIAFFRAYTSLRDDSGNPALYLLNPADAGCAYALTLLMAAFKGACYMRTLRPDTAFLYDEGTEFTLGGYGVLAEGKDLLIVASGYMVHEAVKAVAALKELGVGATLVDLYSLPFDGEAIAALAAQNGGRIITVEDNYGASIGGAVLEAIAECGGAVTARQMYVRTFPKSGRTPDDVLRYLGLSAQDIVDAATELAPVSAR